MSLWSGFSFLPSRLLAEVPGLMRSGEARRVCGQERADPVCQGVLLPSRHLLSSAQGTSHTARLTSRSWVEVAWCVRHQDPKRIPSFLALNKLVCKLECQEKNVLNSSIILSEKYIRQNYRLCFLKQHASFCVQICTHILGWGLVVAGWLIWGKTLLLLGGKWSILTDPGISSYTISRRASS